jgi:NAD(P)H dehydrogenase (quinone)
MSVIYYSSTGTTYAIAAAVAEGAREAGADVRLRKVRELAPEDAIAANDGWVAHAAATEDVPEATGDDMLWADAVVLGSPTRYGNISAQLKQFLDSLGGLWFQGLLADKVYSGFTSSATAHGGQESTLLALYNTIHHFGGILVTPGYTDPLKFADGNPYGTSHVDGEGWFPVDGTTRAAAAYQGKRVATVTAALKAGRALLGAPSPSPSPGADKPAR